MICFYLLLASLSLNDHPLLVRQIGGLPLINWCSLVCLPMALARTVLRASPSRNLLSLALIIVFFRASSRESVGR